ncbi:MAG TPA: hypothetical protein VF550_14945 [Polyangia bacterium]
MMKPCIAAAVAILLCSGCSSEYPPVAEGNRISGTIRYRGSALSSMRRPVVRAYASVTFPPVGQPNGVAIVNPSDLVSQLTGPGLRYEIAWLVPYSYKVIAQIVDLDNPNADYTALPLGGFPDYCTLMHPGEGLVEVNENKPAASTSFGIYDQAGAMDPCTLATCPQSGRSTMRVVIKSSQNPTESDRLRVALFQTLPTDSSQMPDSLRIVSGAGLTFPKVVTDNTIIPGNYVVLNVCLDIGGDSGTGRCTSEDSEVTYAPPSAPLVFSADQIVNLTADLDSGTITLEAPQRPADLGCF